MAPYWDTFDDQDEMVRCGICNAEQWFSECDLGVIGTRRHCRCRACGMTWSRELEEVPGWLEE